MEKLTLKTAQTQSTIYAGSNIFNKLASKITKDRQVFLLTDSKVFEIYSDKLQEFDALKHVFKYGEKNKNFTTLQQVLQSMVNGNLRRNALLIAFGGGVTGDMGGLAAALYMRGIEVLQVPTTLLSQVDSSIGGKTAVNFGGVKNNIGAFYQPKNVICDYNFLQTLAAKEIRCGLGEIIKTACLNGKLFEDVCANGQNLTNPQVYKKFIMPCIRHKAGVVKADEFETKSIRKTLNLGHTTGHALEIFYKNKTHGEYVLYGMLLETKLALALGVCNKEYAQRVINLIGSVVNIKVEFNNIQAALQASLLDKKNTVQNKVSLIVPANIGTTHELNLEFNKYVQLIKEQNNAN